MRRSESEGSRTIEQTKQSKYTEDEQKNREREKICIEMAGLCNTPGFQVGWRTLAPKKKQTHTPTQTKVYTVGHLSWSILAKRPKSCLALRNVMDDPAWHNGWPYLGVESRRSSRAKADVHVKPHGSLRHVTVRNAQISQHLYVTSAFIHTQIHEWDRAKATLSSLVSVRTSGHCAVYCNHISHIARYCPATDESLTGMKMGTIFIFTACQFFPQIYYSGPAYALYSPYWLASVPITQEWQRPPWSQ